MKSKIITYEGEEFIVIKLCIIIAIACRYLVNHMQSFFLKC